MKFLSNLSRKCHRGCFLWGPVVLEAAWLHKAPWRTSCQYHGTELATSICPLLPGDICGSREEGTEGLLSWEGELLGST